MGPLLKSIRSFYRKLDTVHYVVIDAADSRGPSDTRVSAAASRSRCVNYYDRETPCHRQRWPASVAAVTTTSATTTSLRGSPTAMSTASSESRRGILDRTNRNGSTRTYSSSLKRKIDPNTSSSASSIPSKSPSDTTSPSLSTAAIMKMKKRRRMVPMTIPTFKSFNERLQDLKAFKTINGHCDVPRKYRLDPSLGSWCNNVRYSYKQILDGKKPHNSLSSDEIEELTALGFRWTIRRIRRKNK